MKNLSIALGLVLIVGFSSCKKTYDCTCVTTGALTASNTSPTEKLSKKDAEAACDSGDNSSIVFGIPSKTECTLN